MWAYVWSSLWKLERNGDHYLVETCLKYLSLTHTHTHTHTHKSYYYIDNDYYVQNRY